MTYREPFQAWMHYKEVDRLPFYEWLSYWAETLDRWHGEAWYVVHLVADIMDSWSEFLVKLLSKVLEKVKLDYVTI